MSRIVRKLRKERGLNQTDFGAAIGISQAEVSHLENRSRRVTIDLLERAAKFFDVPPAYLLLSEEEFDEMNRVSQVFLRIDPDDRKVILRQMAALAGEAPAASH